MLFYAGFHCIYVATFLLNVQKGVAYSYQRYEALCIDELKILQRNIFDVTRIEHFLALH